MRLYEPFSVLMSVYKGEQPSFFAQSLESVYTQTLIPDEIILVCDGELNPDLEAVIERYIGRRETTLELVRLPQNGGLGKALNEGLKHCHHSLVARMDTDDIALPHRFERQIAYMTEHVDVDVLSTSIDEFCDNPQEILSTRSLPSEHAEISAFARRRSPVNHPAVVFRKETILKAGGYQHLPLFEDYFLWARVLMSGGIFHSLPESLLYFRMNHQTYTRRRGCQYIKSECELQKNFLSMGFISRREYVRNLVLRVPPRMLPAPMLRHFYKSFLRKRHC